MPLDVEPKRASFLQPACIEVKASSNVTNFTRNINVHMYKKKRVHAIERDVTSTAALNASAHNCQCEFVDEWGSRRPFKKLTPIITLEPSIIIYQFYSPCEGLFFYTTIFTNNNCDRHWREKEGLEKIVIKTTDNTEQRSIEHSNRHMFKWWRRSG